MNLIAMIMLAFAPTQATEPVRVRDCSACPTMIVLPAGRFVMGTDQERPAFGPATDAVIERPFALAETETTFDQYQACVDANVCRGVQSDHGWGRGTRPVINVAWHDARAYATWLSQVTGLSYCLPTETEWEYATRAGTVTTYSLGNEIGQGRANCRSCSAAAFDGHQSAPVASFPANPYGFRDLSGNVSEWVADCWTERHDTDLGQIDSDTCERRVTRGGDWYYIPALATSAARMGNVATITSYTIGFRVARDVADPFGRP